MFGNRTEAMAGHAEVATTLAIAEWNADDREDNWLISYADLLSVILAMVVLLFGRIAIVHAMSVVSPAAVTSAAAESAGPESAVPVAPHVAVVTPPQSREDRVADIVERRFRGQIAAERRADGLRLSIRDVALFDSARAQLHESARPVLADLAATLREAGRTRISVEGHTDNVPVQGGEFASNWDLASARANAVTRFLLEQGFDPAALQSVSYADTRPVAANDGEAGRAANRRVELQIEFVAEPD
jgi:chemotaxis protein MotB